jgi:hypothetical protein
VKAQRLLNASGYPKLVRNPFAHGALGLYPSTIKKSSPAIEVVGGFSAGVRAGASGAVGRDAQDAATSGLRAVISVSGHIPVPHRRLCWAA